MRLIPQGTLSVYGRSLEVDDSYNLPLISRLPLCLG